MSINKHSYDLNLRCLASHYILHVVRTQMRVSPETSRHEQISLWHCPGSEFLPEMHSCLAFDSGVNRVSRPQSSYLSFFLYSSGLLPVRKEKAVLAERLIISWNGETLRLKWGNTAVAIPIANSFFHEPLLEISLLNAVPSILSSRLHHSHPGKFRHWKLQRQEHAHIFHQYKHICISTVTIVPPFSIDQMNKLFALRPHVLPHPWNGGPRSPLETSYCVGTVSLKLFNFLLLFLPQSHIVMWAQILNLLCKNLSALGILDIYVHPSNLDAVQPLPTASVHETFCNPFCVTIRRANPLERYRRDDDVSMRCIQWWALGPTYILTHTFFYHI